MGRNSLNPSKSSGGMTRTTPFWVPLDEYFSWKKFPIVLNAQTLTCWKEKAGCKPCEGNLIPNISLGEISKDCVKYTLCVHVCWNIGVLLCQLMCILSPQTWDCNDKYEWSVCAWGDLYAFYMQHNICFLPTKLHIFHTNPYMLIFEYFQPQAQNIAAFCATLTGR